MENIRATYSRYNIYVKRKTKFKPKKKIMKMKNK